MERLQPDHRSYEPNPDAEDEAYERKRQREVDEETEREMAERRLEDLLMSAIRMARVSSDETAMNAVRFVYLQGRIDALLAVKP